MIYGRKLQDEFLHDEYNVHVDTFRKTIKSKCSTLIEKGESLFRGLLFRIEEGKMYVKFASDANLPRLNGASLTCYLLKEDYRKKDIIPKITYEDVINNSCYSFEFKPVAILPQRNPGDKKVVVFSDFDITVPLKISSYENTIVLIGVSAPPLEMLRNLAKYISTNKHNELLDADYSNQDVVIEELKEDQDHHFIIDQLSLQNRFIVQGPPGTGKSFLISNMIKTLCENDSSVLVMSLANRALMEIIEKEPLKDLLQQGKLFKSGIAQSEKKAANDLMRLKNVVPEKGSCHFATFYIASGSPLLFNELAEKYDYVIVDEASEAFLPVLGITLSLGEKQLFVGDMAQLPPVVILNSDQIHNRNYNGIVNGLSTVSHLLKSYQLTQTYRLPNQSATCTSLFYKYKIVSRNDLNKSTELIIGGTKMEISPGTFLIYSDIETFNHLENLITDLVCQITTNNKKSSVAVLSHTIKCNRQLTNAIYSNATIQTDKILVETVHRIQGLTTNYSIFVVENSSIYIQDERLFNVATSRGNTLNIIILDKRYISFLNLENVGIKQFVNLLREQGRYFVI